MHGCQGVQALHLAALGRGRVVVELTSLATLATPSEPELAGWRAGNAAAGVLPGLLIRRLALLGGASDEPLEVVQTQALGEQARDKLVGGVVGLDVPLRGLHALVGGPRSGGVAGALARAQERVDGAHVRRHGGLLPRHLVQDGLSRVHVPRQHVPLQQGGVHYHVGRHAGDGFHALEHGCGARHVARVDVGVDETGVRVRGGD
mmetsp:Transcript_28286/g.69658  ORF Transcript_28286/g.69658 Transcript_28286/m.69658 type:complete len:204 (-) Transcript_28286:57-668(-)